VGHAHAQRYHSLAPCASALREGVSFSFHSDAGVTPLGPLHTMWCAVNRITPSGRVLGEAEKITVAQALKGATIDAAYQLHLDHEIGSLEAGKQADFAVLHDDPLAVDPMALKDVAVWGTVLGGRKFKAAG
jgi:predicted amidohydrolase YtcJ